MPVRARLTPAISCRQSNRDRGPFSRHRSSSDRFRATSLHARRLRLFFDSASIRLPRLAGKVQLPMVHVGDRGPEANAMVKGLTANRSQRGMRRSNSRFRRKGLLSRYPPVPSRDWACEAVPTNGWPARVRLAYQFNPGLPGIIVINSFWLIPVTASRKTQWMP